MRGDFTAGDAMRGADEEAHHAVHEAVAMQAQAQQRPFPLHGAAVEGADVKIRGGRIRLITAAGSKAAEIVLTFVDSQGLLQQVDIERMRKMPGAILPKRAQHRRGADDIFIDLALRIKPRVEVIRNGLHVQNANAAGEIGIERGKPVLRAHTAGLRDIGVKVLSLRMHTGICAAGGSNADRLAQDAGHGLLDGVLHGAAAGLALPAAIWSAIVGALEEKTRHADFLKRNRSTRRGELRFGVHQK